MRIFLRIIGIAAILMGLLWVGQGAGLIMWPASSFMLAQKQWMLWGSGLALLGAAAVWRSSRR
ncbi:hypothetical protein [Novosphingobium sp. FKTRR1]|uniref:hypothetical protein n=1 Tax=unclassified Novosphingobium TaxID=2644732 RepID=UPI001CF04CEF|nr:hypothetical protein [Novosphingobium sp. FKTRR1]